MKNTLIAIASTLAIGAVAVSYTTVGISQEAKDVVVAKSVEWKMSQRDTVSRIVMDSVATTTTPVTVGWDSIKVKSPNVSISIIRLESENPAKYSLVRTVTESTENDGNYIFNLIPLQDLVGETYVQIGCEPSAVACEALLIKI